MHSLEMPYGPRDSLIFSLKRSKTTELPPDAPFVLLTQDIDMLTQPRLWFTAGGGGACCTGSGSVAVGTPGGWGGEEGWRG